MDIKNEVLYRVYFLLFGMIVPAALFLLYRTVFISYWEGEKWREKGKDLYVEMRSVEAERGNILAADGSLLATSIPYFDIYMDPNSTGMSDEDFQANIDSLAYCIARYVDNTYTPGGFREFLTDQRNKGVRYLPIKLRASYAEKRFIEQFPLFNLGRMRGGFIAQIRSERRRPFGVMAQRTIGYVRDGALDVGLEGSFNNVLGGNPGSQLMIQVDRSRDIWVPVSDLTQVEPRSGDDVVTTLDVNLQGIVQEALLRAMDFHDADWGTAILMEVKTGAIRALSNLGRTEKGWWETFNYAIGAAVEPGSTFKLASIMALLEDGYVDLDDTVSIEYGRTKYYNQELLDASPLSSSLDSITVKEAFQISSNVGMSKLVTQYYGNGSGKDPREQATRFIKRLQDFNLHLPTGIEVPGEASPYIKEPFSVEDQWSGTTLPWMSIGYESRITPLQLLTFFNAVANDGRMMKPYLVSEIQRFGDPVQEFRPTVIKRSIASRSTIRQAQELLEAVVTDGTAATLRSGRYRFAGKTGTAQINYRRHRNGTLVGGYQASFAGYFPAERPLYSCIVMINNPRRNGIYGSDVAGPVFREIADNCFASDLRLHRPLNVGNPPKLAAETLPGIDVGMATDLREVLNWLNIAYTGKIDGDIGVLNPKSDTLYLLQRVIPERQIPNVVGMGLRDALFLLENRGLRVQARGVGKVARQSLQPGTPVRGQQIVLTLN